MQNRCTFLVFVVGLSCTSVLHAAGATSPDWPGFQKGPWFDEQISYLQLEPDVRLIIVAPRPERIILEKPSRVVLFAAPNGSTIEQTLGCQQAAGRDWHFDIQHIAAQHRKWQFLNQRENLILVCLEAKGLSWPRWRAKHPENPKLIRKVIAETLQVIPLQDPQITLACHSGGGSFLWGFLNGSDTIPALVDRLIFLDANYSFQVADQHGKKMLEWLKGDKKRTLVVLSYDDRSVLFRGKKVVSPTGGTFRATHRMLDRFKQDLEFRKIKQGEFDSYTGMEGQIRMLIHTNRKNQILHTRLVGEMNGYLFAATVQTPEGESRGVPKTPRAYTKWIQPEPFEQPKKNQQH